MFIKTNHFQTVERSGKQSSNYSFHGDPGSFQRLFQLHFSLFWVSTVFFHWLLHPTRISGASQRSDCGWGRGLLLGARTFSRLVALLMSLVIRAAWVDEGSFSVFPCYCLPTFWATGEGQGENLIIHKLIRVKNDLSEVMLFTLANTLRGNIASLIPTTVLSFCFTHARFNPSQRSTWWNGLPGCHSEGESEWVPSSPSQSHHNQFFNL